MRTLSGPKCVYIQGGPKSDTLSVFGFPPLLDALYTVLQKKLVHQAHNDNLVNSQRIFKILSLTHSAENLL